MLETKSPAWLQECKHKLTPLCLMILLWISILLSSVPHQFIAEVDPAISEQFAWSESNITQGSAHKHKELLGLQFASHQLLLINAFLTGIPFKV